MFKKMTLALFLFGISLPLLAQSKTNSTIDFDANLEDLLHEFKKAKVQNLTEAVELLDKKFFAPGQYALVFNSRSIQPSSLKFPRVLLLGKGQKLRLGFNHRMGTERDLEIIQWRDKQQRWELREVKFKDGQVKASKPNPMICLQCHGLKPKPKFKGHFLKSFTNVLSGPTNMNAFRAFRHKDPIYSKFTFPINE